MKAKLSLLAAGLVLAACTTAPPDFSYAPPISPEIASGWTDKPGWATSRFAVAAANPLAADAGYQVLRAGGSAIDAAVAVQMVLGLVEPQSSGIGGGALLLHFNGKEVEAFDGRETAPAAATDRLFLGADGKPIPFSQAVVGGRSVGVPGAVRMLEAAHRRYGKLPWARLFDPAIALAERGFAVSPRLHAALRSSQSLRNDPIAAALYYRPDGEALEVGATLRNPALATVLRRIAAEGSKALHEGTIARAIVDKVRRHPTNPGTMDMGDLAGYQPKEREAICHDHRARAREFRICGFPPPGSGGIAVGQILGIMSNLPAASIPLEGGVPAASWLYLYTEASRLAFADRAQYIADPDFVQAPGGDWKSLLATGYLAARAKLVGERSMKSVQPGLPGAVNTAWAPMPDQPEEGTSHISIVDGGGNALAMTTTIENQFGSRQMVGIEGRPGGFLLNNELTDFSFAPTGPDGAPVANRVEPGKRPRSSMAPTIVIDKATGRVELVAGSPGSAFIIHFVSKTLYGVLDWGLNTQQAISLPNFGWLSGPVVLERQRFPSATIESLRGRGIDVREQDLPSGIQSIQRTPSGWFGGADPRREGVVMGD
jgi:gamma-glutamyltranspeptidase / glutathione hydrolase